MGKTTFKVSDQTLQTLNVLASFNYSNGAVDASYDFLVAGTKQDKRPAISFGTSGNDLK